ncbi:hypothetical protein HKBW3S33_02121, partial [Candidatus Hakubella thermalkaliphila]
SSRATEVGAQKDKTTEILRQIDAKIEEWKEE